MDDLAKCCDDCAPVLQTRKDMGPGDYFGVISDGAYISDEPAGSPAINHYKFVALTSNNEHDIRVACPKCFLAIGWCTANVPNMPGVGLTYCKDLWAKRVDDKLTKAKMLATLEEQFGKDNIKKFFKHSL